jgi:lipopolysaccharide transport system ATP-binding protein
MNSIEAKGISKKFKLQNGPRVFLNLIFSAFASSAPIGQEQSTTTLQALNSVDVSVSSGEVVGLIGKNGSGKSTLLKILAGLHAKDSGSIRLNGKILYLSGFHYASNPYMTVRENIFLMATIFGLRRAEIYSRLPEILEFAGLERFVDVKAFKLSSGMQTRLNVSATFHCMERINPSIILLDEALSTGGDMEFQTKSLKKIEHLVKSGAAVLVATHDLSFVEKFCDRAILLEAGNVRKIGNPADVIRDYATSYA